MLPLRNLYLSLGWFSACTLVTNLCSLFLYVHSGNHLATKAARAGKSFAELSCQCLAILETWKSLAAYALETRPLENTWISFRMDVFNITYGDIYISPRHEAALWNLKAYKLSHLKME